MQKPGAGLRAWELRHLGMGQEKGVLPVRVGVGGIGKDKKQDLTTFSDESRTEFSSTNCSGPTEIFSRSTCSRTISSSCGNTVTQRRTNDSGQTGADGPCVAVSNTCGVLPEDCNPACRASWPTAATGCIPACLKASTTKSRSSNVWSGFRSDYYFFLKIKATFPEIPR